MSPNDETLVGYARDNTLYSFPLGNVDIMDADDDAGFSEHFSHVGSGGLHSGGIVALDICLHKPLIATVGETDKTVRVWNYLRRRCELVHRATNDEPTCVAFHPSGFEMLVGYKERVRLYSVLLSELKASGMTVCDVLWRFVTCRGLHSSRRECRGAPFGFDYRPPCLRVGCVGGRSHERISRRAPRHTLL